MKTTSARAKPGSGKDLEPEYVFDYEKAKPNRFASQMTSDTVAVVLDPDVAAVFQSAESVNQLLRSVLLALPATAKT
jgi:hypothetical protein